MDISISVYGARIGTFNGGIIKGVDTKPVLFTTSYVMTMSLLMMDPSLINIFITIALLLSGDIHPNLGPHIINNKLKICHVNIRSIRNKNKLDHISNELVGKYDIIALSETWLTSTDNTFDYRINGYQGPFRRDRTNGRVGYGGVLFWVKDFLGIKRRKDLEHQNLENIWAEIKNGHQNFLINIIYRPPNSSLDFWNHFQDNIILVNSKSNSKFIILGDLNSDLKSQQGKHLIEFCDANNLFHFVQTPTRITSSSQTILDQCLSNSYQFIEKIEITPPLPGCDHSTVIAHCNFHIPVIKNYNRVMWKFDSCDYSHYKRNLSEADWLCLKTVDIEVAASSFTDQLYNIAKTSIPNTLVTVRTKDKPWFNSELRKQRRRTIRIYKRFKSNQNLYNETIYKNEIKNYQLELKNTKAEFYKS